MADEHLAKTLLKYETDRKSLQDTIAGVDALKSRLVSLSNAQDELTDSSQKLGSALRASFGSSSDRSLKRLVELRTEAARGKGTWDEYRTSVLNAGKATKSSVDLFRAESLTQSAGRALSGLGLGGAGEAFGGAADILQLRNTLTSALTSITAVQGGIAAAGVTFAAALGPIVAVGAPLLLLKGIMDNLKTSAENAAKAEEERYQAELKQLERNAKIRQDAATKTAEQHQKEYLETDKQLTDTYNLYVKKLAERKKVEEDYAALGASLNPAERSRLGELGQQLDKEIEDLSKRYKDLQITLSDQIKVIDPLIKKREEETAAAKKLTEQHDLLAAAMRRDMELDEQYQQDLINRRNLNFNKALEDEKKAAKDRADAEDRIIDATRKASADIESIETRSLEQRARIQDQYNQRIVDITRQAADAAASALTNLTQQRQDLATELSRDFGKAERDARAQELDIRIDAQREEARSLREHERNKQRILDDSRDKEFELILNRDFLGLFNLRRQTGRDLGRADTDFVAQRQERQIAGNDQLSDLRRQLVQERQERLIAYQQQLADAQLSYNRELQQIAQRRAQELLIVAQTRNAELSQLRSSTTAALTLRRNQAAEEIRTAGLVGQARINYLNQERQLLLRQSATYSTASTGGTTARAALRDGGGPLRAGQLAVIGVPGEAFNGYALPSPGLLMPTVPGNVTKHTNISPTWNISGNNPDQIGQVVRGQFEGLLRAYLGDG